MLGGLRLGGIKIRELIQLFMHLEQMQSAGVPLLEALADIRDATDNDYLRDVMTEIYRDVSDGSALSEAMAKHPKTFNNLYISLIASSEETGDMSAAYLQLVKYLKWVDQMQSKVRKATRYPIVVLVVVLLTITVMMAYVVPQIVGFLKNLDQEIPFYTQALIATSDFFMVYWWAVILFPIVLIGSILTLRNLSDEFAYWIDYLMLNAPVVGSLIRKINIARFSQTFGALFSSGMDIIGALKSSRNTVKNRALIEALESVEEQIKAGNPLSDAMNACGEFPSLVIRMVRVGEESGNLTVVLDQVSEFYTNDVDEEVQGMIAMIEPSLTLLLGGMILWIAAGVFGPIYSSFENIEF